jgi:hypothetical protein
MVTGGAVDETNGARPRAEDARGVIGRMEQRRMMRERQVTV